MDAGKVIATGDPKAVLSNSAVIEAYLGSAT
jgi:ABC-type branched-subunit amino acid transport system ATPase component